MKTILVTGSTSATGTAIVKALAERNCRLVLHYHAHHEQSQILANWLDEKAVEHRFFRADLTVPNNAKSLIDLAVKGFGRIDVLVNSVGPFAYRSILDVTPEQWLEDINLNLNTCFFTSHYALDELREIHGHIVNFTFSGVENLKAWPMSTGYCAAKTGVAALTKSLAAALAADRVRVNAVCPGLVEEGPISAEERQHMASQIPYGRPVHPDEIGQTVAWLIYDSPEIMTGSLLTVSGGWEY